MKFKKVSVLTGNYGCGKTNLAVNLALLLSECGSVSVVDIDTVNPYFRTADFTELLRDKGINVFYPKYAGTNLDIPVLNFDLESIITESDFTIIDVGGSDAGAYPIRRYSDLFKSIGDDLEMLYVFNMYRLIDRPAEETAEMMREIERAAGFKCTALVNNSNLGIDTTPQIILQTADYARDVERITGLPLAFTCVTENETGDEKHLPVKRLVNLPWEDSGMEKKHDND